MNIKNAMASSIYTQEEHHLLLPLDHLLREEFVDQLDIIRLDIPKKINKEKTTIHGQHNSPRKNFKDH